MDYVPLRYSLPCDGDMCDFRVDWCEDDPMPEPLLCSNCRMTGNYPADWDDPFRLRDSDVPEDPYEEK